MPPDSKAGALAEGRRPSERPTLSRGLEKPAFAVATTVEHRQVRVEPLQHDLGRVLVRA